MQDDRIVIATRNTEGTVRHFISLPKSMKDTWPEVQWRRTSDRDSGGGCCVMKWSEASMMQLCIEDLTNHVG